MPALILDHVWSIRVRLEIARKLRDLALFNLAIDSKLRTCDLGKLRLDEVCSGAKVRDRLRWQSNASLAGSVLNADR
jgi:hypothetical protein